MCLFYVRVHIKIFRNMIKYLILIYNQQKSGAFICDEVKNGRCVYPSLL